MHSIVPDVIMVESLAIDQRWGRVVERTRPERSENDLRPVFVTMVPNRPVYRCASADHMLKDLLIMTATGRLEFPLSQVFTGQKTCG